jgi:hypothetical protein
MTSEAWVRGFGIPRRSFKMASFERLRGKRPLEMTRFPIAIPIAACLCAPMQSHAEESNYRYSFQHIYDECKTPTMYCLGYIEGIIDTINATGHVFAFADNLAEEKYKIRTLHFDFYSICLGDASFGALAQAVVNWGQQHPERWSEDAWSGVHTAIHEKWPCKK